MNTITNVIGVSVPVTDQDDGLAFFAGTLGFETRRDVQLPDARRWVTVAVPGASVEIALQQDPDRVGRDTGIRFATVDARSEHDRLSRQGIAVDQLLEWPGVPPMFKFHDPDGNVFTVVQAS